MIKVTRMTTDIIEVQCIMMSFLETKEHFSYFDTTNWENVSKPDLSKRTSFECPKGRKMSVTEIQWVKRHYIPKIPK
jgi:hypothetical protein